MLIITLKFLTIQTALDFQIEYFHGEGSSESTNRQTGDNYKVSYVLNYLDNIKNIYDLPITINKPQIPTQF
jgi:hypothetical protein